MKSQLSLRASCCSELVLASPSPSPSLPLHLPLPLSPAPLRRPAAWRRARSDACGDVQESLELTAALLASWRDVCCSLHTQHTHIYHTVGLMSGIQYIIIFKNALFGRRVKKTVESLKTSIALVSNQKCCRTLLIKMRI